MPKEANKYEGMTELEIRWMEEDAKYSVVFANVPKWDEDPDYFAAERVKAKREARCKQSRPR